MKKRINRFAAWWALLGVVLHAFVPIAGMAPYGLPAHGHAAHSHGSDEASVNHAAHSDHSHETAHEAPAAPDTFCVGDCPCCITTLKAFVPSRSGLILRLRDLRKTVPEAPQASLQISERVHDHLARGPPQPPERG